MADLSSFWKSDRNPQLVVIPSAPWSTSSVAAAMNSASSSPLSADNAVVADYPRTIR
ncbi:MAG: hypothetical protein ACI8VW_003782 [bacterium]|jgi:hypothetical protein